MSTLHAALLWLRQPPDPEREYSAMRQSVQACCLWLLVLVAVIVFAVLLTLHLLSTH